MFVSDGSALINAMYDYEGFNEGKYGPTDTMMPANDNRKWALDFIAEALMSERIDEVGEPAENAMVIFDESRHPQSALAADSYNTVYFLLVYFTGEGLAMLLHFLILFITFEAVLIKKRDPEPWRHVFSIIYYGFEMQSVCLLFQSGKNSAGLPLQGSQSKWLESRRIPSDASQ